jgi:peptidoglycan/xylan/chitin deacetylase (PgdA/CDA1 family)
MIYPYVSGKVLDDRGLRALDQFALDGGTVIAVNVLGGGLQKTFGFDSIAESKNHFLLEFSEEPFVAELKIGSDGKMAFGDSRRPDTLTGSISYGITDAGVLARYENGDPAIIKKSNGKGEAYVVGLDLGFLFQRSFNNRADDVNAAYINTYQPGIDSLLRLIEKIYYQNESTPVLIARTPLHYPLAVLMTHDVDYQESFGNSRIYAELEKQYRIKATYFIQTKYLKDYQDVATMTKKTISVIWELRDAGMEVASHSVSHSLQFTEFPLGTGEERFPEYQPFVVNEEKTKGGSVLGELRISKFLLEKVLDGYKVVSFRPGYLGYPYSLPQALEATGYLYSSSVSANTALTHLPFRLNYDREYAASTDIFEFPITIEDEESPEMDQRVDAALSIAESISAYNGLFTVLIHPNILGSKFIFEKKFLEKTAGLYWFGTVGEFGNWWSARDKVASTVRNEGKSIVITLSSETEFFDIAIKNIPGYKIDAQKSPEATFDAGRYIISGKHKSYDLYLTKE